MTRPTLSIFIPAYNAATTITNVVERIPENLWPKIDVVMVINDGSTDDTVAVVTKLSSRYPKLSLHSFDSNVGYGEAVRWGLRFCRERGSAYAACLHADGQYPPEKLESFLGYMKQHQVDILQGSRHLMGTAKQGGMPLYKIIAGKSLTWLENRCFGLDFTDYHSGFLVYSQEALCRIPFEKLSTYFDFDLEVIASARDLNLRLAELGIPTRYAGEKSYLNPWKYGLRTLKVMIKYRMGLYR